jgi:hypothetical protein
VSMMIISLFGSALLAVLVGTVLFHIFPAVRTYFLYRGKRIVICPETHLPEAVDVAAGKAAISALFAEPEPRLRHCSRWPERRDCGQECLNQIEADPDNCLVWNIVSNWYEGQSCALCHMRFGRLRHMDPPALMGPDGKTIGWDEFPAQQLPEIFSRYQPVCWNCHVTETFRRVHPEVVTGRKE